MRQNKSFKDNLADRPETDGTTGYDPRSGGSPDRRPLVIGITGGMGSGKSTVLSYIKSHYPVTVISADQVGREMMAPGQPIYTELVRVYGQSILKSDSCLVDKKDSSNEAACLQELDRKALALLVLQKEGDFSHLNQIEHPLIREEILKRVQKAQTPVVFIEAALLKEGGLIPDCDEVWTVASPEDVRIRRLMKDRGYTEEEAKAFISRQLRSEDFQAFSARVLNNKGSLEEMEEEADKAMAAIAVSKIC